MTHPLDAHPLATHPLDRPIWASLSTRQAALALGDGHARRLAPEYGLFAAGADHSAESLAALGELIRRHGQAALVEAEPAPDAPGAAAVSSATLWQMIAERPRFVEPDFEVVALGDADAPEMLALATLTRPGPFFARTHQLGDFIGVRQGGRLAAMAGERMKPDGFTEVSAVCTHPEHRGRGYAAGLMSLVARRIVARGEVPFLHVYGHNTGAIALYRALGYQLRREMVMTVLAPA